METHIGIITFIINKGYEKKTILLSDNRMFMGTPFL